MSIEISGFGSASAFDRDTFGAAVVSETLDIMNGSRRGSALPVDGESAGAAVVSKTLDYMNSGSSSGDPSGMSQSYNFQMDVLGADAMGALVNTLV